MLIHALIIGQIVQFDFYSMEIKLLALQIVGTSRKIVLCIWNWWQRSFV